MVDVGGGFSTGETTREFNKSSTNDNLEQSQLVSLPLANNSDPESAYRWR